ncbi:L-fucose isomerase [Clostridium perfringens]|uniref:L-fucose isomerase n=1 Tax=Clostridium perfringens TaxID=1502 RepID=UPI000E4BD565|nr:L-fucose isomerase [Clostridium perfringens]MDK0739370.1 L-fucose isomerase [Clostridium perfringens]MDK0805659.1 L-fucose isomerase [Clostridium perfringens]RHN25557.1 L-fucose isomerase [Clostridium perfringens]
MKTYPKIGIRPTIDGRQGGVRESLEEKAMKMAQAAKKLIENSLYYADGTPVQCVLASRTIGGSGDAGIVQQEFTGKNIVATLSVTPSWCYGTETMDLDPNTIKAIWGFNGTERPGAVYLAAAMSGYAQKGIPAFKIYGHDVQELDDDTIPVDVQEKILSFARGAIAVGQMKGKSYVNIGASSMGIAGSQVDISFFEDYLGMLVEFVDMTEILRRIHLEIFDPIEYDKALNWIKENCREGIDINEGKDLPDIVKKSKVIPADKDWEFIAKQAIIIRDILYGNEKLGDLGWEEEARGRNAIAGGFQGQRQWTDWLPNGDFTEAIMASTFDWNGPRQVTAFATENDTLNGVSMLLGTLLTNKAPIFSDVRTYWSPESVKRVTGKELTEKAKNGIIHLINSGASALDGTAAAKDKDGNKTMKEFWNMTNEDVQSCLKATDWCRANYEYFRGGGFSSHFKTEAELPVTLIRVNLIKGIGPTLQIAEGYTCVIDEDIHQILDERTDKTWPTTWFAPNLGECGFETVYDVMNHWGANHGAFVHGHIGSDLITLASMLRIPVTLHNVPRERIFRPNIFEGAGTKALETSDFEICRLLGPLYKK